MEFYMFSSPDISKARILEASRISEIVNLIDEETWFIVDLDNTLFEAQQALGHAHWFYDEIEQKMQLGMSREDAIQQLYPLWIKIQSVCLVKPVEEAFITSILSLQKRGGIVMGLTHRQPSVASTTLCQIQSLGLDLSSTAPHQTPLKVPSQYPTLYQEGVLFVGDYNDKGEIFTSWLYMINKKPKKILFIDDKRKNVEELETALKILAVDYIGVHYTGIDRVKPVYSKELAQIQYQFFNKILSNEAAAILKEQGF